MKSTRTFTVAGDAVVELGGHNDSGKAPKAQSVYYVDVNVADLANVNKLVTVLKLNNSNTWELDGAVVADGFKASFEYNEISELLTVTVERTGVSGRALTNTLVSIPVRVWTWDRYDYVTNQYVAVSGNMPVVNIDCDVVYGVVDGNSFGGSINVATELATISSPYHVHDAALVALEDQDATCTMNGYQDRTYCATCESVVDFGTVIEAKGHEFSVVDAQFVCDTCGETPVLGTGVVEMGDALYYAVNGKLVKGWQDMGVYEGDDYINGGAPFNMYGYAGSDYKLYADTTKTISGITYTFDENGATLGAFTTNSTGTRYSVGPAYIKRSWVTLAGVQYYFGQDHYMYTGIRRIPVNRNNAAEGYNWYTFADNGALADDMRTFTGIVNSEVDGMHYVKDGMSYYAGLILVDGDYYYARSSGQILTNTSYWISKNNDLLPCATYEFGADGKMLNPPVVEPEQPEQPEQPAVKNGIVSEDGKLWWYVDGVKTYGGLMLIDGDYYYARSSGQILTNTSYWITKNNDLLPCKTYEFGADGKMVNPPVVEPEQPEQPEQPAVKNGIVSEDGKLWWYVDGVKTYGGLMLIDGDYYYARSSGQILTNTSYWITKNNDLLPCKTYEFGADGKMIK